MILGIINVLDATIGLGANSGKNLTGRLKRGISGRHLELLSPNPNAGMVGVNAGMVGVNTDIFLDCQKIQTFWKNWNWKNLM